MPQYYKNLNSQCISCIYQIDVKNHVTSSLSSSSMPPHPCPPEPCPPEPCPPEPCPPHPCPPHPCPPHPCPPHPCDNCDDEYYNKNTLVLSRLEKLLIEINNVNNDDDCNNIYDDYLDYDENCYTNFIIVKPKKCEKNNNIPDQKKNKKNKQKKHNCPCKKKI